MFLEKEKRDRIVEQVFVSLRERELFRPAKATPKTQELAVRAGVEALW